MKWENVQVDFFDESFWDEDMQCNIKITTCPENVIFAQKKKKFTQK